MNNFFFGFIYFILVYIFFGKFLWDIKFEIEDINLVLICGYFKEFLC